MLAINSFARFLLIVSLGISLTSRADQLDDFIRADMKAHSIPAIVFGVFKDGKIKREGAFGLANVELKVPATVKNVFEIGSVTKQFTATLILMLKDEGRLELDEPLDKYLDNLPKTWQAVTIRQLLNHTSGIPDIEEIFGYDSYRNIYSYDQIIAVANSRPVDFPAGTKWHYSNTGYYLLGHVLEKIEGKLYDEILRARILNPLGMTHTRQSDPANIITNRCAGYQLTENGLGNRDAMQPTACLAAGTIVSSIEDMAKWDSAITHNRLLKSETQKLMWETTPLSDGSANYGFGWFIDEYNDIPFVEHSGGTAGFTCDYFRFKKLGISVIVFCNLYSTDVQNIAIKAVESMHPGLSYASDKPIQDDPEIHAMLLNAMADIANGGAGSLYVTEALWKACNDASRQALKNRLAHLESFQLLEHIRYKPVESEHGEPTVETYVYRMKSGGMSRIVSFKLTADGKIAIMQRIE